MTTRGVGASFLDLADPSFDVTSDAVHEAREPPQVAHWADDLGKSFRIQVRRDLPRIEAALEGLTAYVEEVVADRRAHPANDLVSTLVTARDRDDALHERELSVGVVFLAFAGMETTRNQLGLALQTFLRRGSREQTPGSTSQPPTARHTVGSGAGCTTASGTSWPART